MIDLCLENYFKILENIRLLSNAAKRNLLIDISILINVSNNKETTELICPYCKNKYIVKNGKNKETQRYLCKACVMKLSFKNPLREITLKMDLLCREKHIKEAVNQDIEGYIKKKYVF
ncbi:hypothetical protein [Clostridium sp. DSM 8431]|uniref:transposase-like zinc-binding domain-containing protein n=1 Tax=Clostridium sp. DSM 8431 TaxID=1761781 RepID=UPI001FA8B4FC|nr:hypothetical protein [Clostridium sp. DSM 8431]